MERPLNAGTAIVGTVLSIFVGLMWSREVLSRGTFGFDMGYLPVAVAVSWGSAAVVGGLPVNMRTRLVLFRPIISVFAFEGLADYSLSRLHTQMSLRWILAFGVFSSLLLLTTLVLVATFNYTEAFGAFSPNERRSWRKWTVSAALALGTLVIWGPARILMAFGTVPTPPAMENLRAALIALQSWFYKSSLMVYLFIIVRMFFPTWNIES